MLNYVIARYSMLTAQLWWVNLYGWQIFDLHKYHTNNFLFTNTAIIRLDVSFVCGNGILTFVWDKEIWTNSRNYCSSYFTKVFIYEITFNKQITQ